MPEDVAEVLAADGVRDAYDDRPAYRRNDYLICIDRTRTPATREKRMRQMIGELKRGSVYMKMAWRPAGVA